MVSSRIQRYLSEGYSVISSNDRASLLRVLSQIEAIKGVKTTTGAYRRAYVEVNRVFGEGSGAEILCMFKAERNLEGNINLHRVLVRRRDGDYVIWLYDDLVRGFTGSIYSASCTQAVLSLVTLYG